MEGRRGSERIDVYPRSSPCSLMHTGTWIQESTWKCVTCYPTLYFGRLNLCYLVNQRAVSLLCDVRLNRDYTSKIIQAISLSDTPTRLLLQYLRTAKPMLTEPDDMDIYILALAEDSLTNAWQYQRTFPEKSETRTRLTRKVLEWCFSREPHFVLGFRSVGSITVAKPRPEHLKQLIFFPLSPFEQSLLHNFALDPPISIPASSIPVLQDLVCVRLVQSGEYVEAMKLDRQFASTRRGVQGPQVAERRRKIIEDVVAALPFIERLEIEEKLQADDQHKPEPLPKPPQIKAPGDLSMSWEAIPTPLHLPPTTSGALRFVLGRPTYEHNQPKVLTGPVKEVPPTQPVRLLLPSARTTGAESAVPPGLNGASRAQNYVPTLPPPSSMAVTKGGLFGPGPRTNKPFLYSAGSASHRPSPLFPPRAPQGPLPATNEQPILYSQKTTPSEEVDVQDSSAQRDIIPPSSKERRTDGKDQHRNLPQAADLAPVAEFPESVFLSSRHDPSPVTREPTEPLLPGAFRAEREGTRPEPISFAHSPPTPPTRLRPAKARRTARTSVPGGFDDTASGEEDNVPPLPDVSSVKRTTRRRVSRASSADGEEDGAPVKPRRSSRLSAASSSPDPSPQKTSAPKATRKTRSSAGSSATTGKAAATRSSMRKKR